MGIRGARWIVLGFVVAVAGACVAEPGSSGVPVRSSRPTPTVAPTTPPAPSPEPTHDASPTPAAAPSPAAGSTIVTLSGSGALRSDPFAVDEDWAIAWERDGSRLFSVQLIPAEVDVFGELIVSTTGPATGSSPMYRAGTYVVQVHATEPWTIRVLDFLPVPARSIPAAVAGSGPTNTDRFVADGRFLIEWTADGTVPFGIELVTLTTGEPLLIAAAAHAETSCRAVSVADEFYLHVVTDASWTLALRPASGEFVCPED